MADDPVPSIEQLRMIAASTRLLLDFVHGRRTSRGEKVNDAIDSVCAVIDDGGLTYRRWGLEQQRQLSTCFNCVLALVGTLKKQPGIAPPEQAWTPAISALPTLDSLIALGPDGHFPWDAITADFHGPLRTHIFRITISLFR